MPDYFTSKGTPFGIERVECDECPKSYVTQQSKEFIRIHQRIKRANAAGVQLYAPGQIDARTADAILVIEDEEAAIQNARFDVERAESR